MRIEVKHRCSDFDSYRAARVKSLFNAENGCNWERTAELPIEDMEWKIGLIVGPSGSGKTSIGSRIFRKPIYDLYADWDKSKPIVDCIAPNGDFNAVTGALSAVGLGDVPAWLRPFHVLSNGEKFRAGLARLVCERPEHAVVDEFTSVIDRQIAKVGAAAFATADGMAMQLKAVLAPMLIAAVGIVLSIIGIFLVRTKEGATMRELLRSLGVGVNFSSLLIAAATFGILCLLGVENWVGLSFSVITGLVAGIVIGQATEYFTSHSYKPTQKIAGSAQRAFLRNDRVNACVEHIYESLQRFKPDARIAPCKGVAPEQHGRSDISGRISRPHGAGVAHYQVTLQFLGFFR